MSTSVIEPGTRLAGRYRLEERISDSGGSSLWKAVDEILARAVAVRTFDPEFPRIAEVITSARAASRLTDPRLTQVFDADDSGENAYVVSEWVVGETLEQMLGKGPLEPGRAATLLYEAAEAIAAAYTAGLTHLCLSPRDLVWTTGGTVKLLGIATDAALRDCRADDPDVQDVRGLGAMLYAALTAHWPGDPARSALPAAPATDDVPHAPRQVQAGIAQGVNDIVCRCLGIGDGEPITTPAGLATALRGVPRTPLPLFAGLGGGTPPPPRRTAVRPAPARPAPRPHESQPQPHSQTRSQPQAHHTPAPPATAPVGAHRSGGKGKGGRGLLLGVAAAALTVIVGLGAWALAGDDKDDPGTGGNTGARGQTGGQPAQPTAKPSVDRLKADNAIAAEDPIGGHLDPTIKKNPGAVIDGRDSTVWSTQTYADVNFGRYSKGLGVVLDMGRPVKVQSVKVAGVEGGGTLQVRIGDSQTPTDLTSIGRNDTVSGETTINVSAQKAGRYVLVWFTKLPRSCKGRMSEITVLGASAG
ncbi:protein kinase family protein [Actinomadura hibisca]|uniref:protein kinase family protein n=1 Tax=Actinomadura hibisca TaxID=68565 RepID=UPI000831E58B|nr:protein kinase family protein [Actinomadura hibisca]